MGLIPGCDIPKLLKMVLAAPRLALRYKVFKNGNSGSLLGTQIYGVELGLVDPVSG